MTEIGFRNDIKRVIRIYRRGGTVVKIQTILDLFWDPLTHEYALSPNELDIIREELAEQDQYDCPQKPAVTLARQFPNE